MSEFIMTTEDAKLFLKEMQSLHPYQQQEHSLKIGFAMAILLKTSKTPEEFTEQTSKLLVTPSFFWHMHNIFSSDLHQK